jgi:hypothetical protein
MVVGGGGGIHKAEEREIKRCIFICSRINFVDELG